MLGERSSVVRHAAEDCCVDDVLAHWGSEVQFVSTLVRRIQSAASLPDGGRVLEVGCGAGGMLAALSRLGFECVGVDPSAQARDTALRVGEACNAPVCVHAGSAERLPFPSESFDLVLARSVLEHVSDPEMAISEVARVLRNNGLFWFQTASSMCPFQNEIDGFPFFGWYPLPIKRRIMNWAKTKKPHLVGYTAAPAVHWVSNRYAGKLVRQANMSVIANRWQLRQEGEGGFTHKVLLQTLKHCPALQCFADAVVATCSFLAIKSDSSEEFAGKLPAREDY